MKKRKLKNRKLNLLIGSFLFILGASIVVIRLSTNYLINKQEENAVNDFLEIEQEVSVEYISNDKQDNKPKKSVENIFNYIAVLEIPSINLKRGLLSINDKDNNINKNIKILKESDMPDVENGLLILAGHSGNLRIAFFKNLYKLNANDLIFIYYQNIKYVYKITSVESQEKKGSIEISKVKEKTELVLTTCDSINKNRQIVIRSELIDKQHY